MRITVALTLGALATLAPAVALAQDADDCPGDGWFCEPAPEPEPAPPDAAPPASPDPSEEPVAPPPVDLPEDTDGEPDVVDAPDQEEPRIIVSERAKERRRKGRRRDRRPPSEWGINLRLQGVMMGGNEQRDRNAGMGGMGFSLRYRPIPHFAFDAGLDLLGGTDYEGNERRETALLLSGIVFFNPKSPVQVYTLGGFGFSGANVNVDGTQEKYSYFGGHLGAGLEFRLAKSVALNTDIVGFVRGRTDDDAAYDPEFVDPATGRTTNMSGGGLFRGGLTIYW